MLIDRLNNIEDIINLQEKFYKENGMYPLNVSNWTVSDIFRKEMESLFRHNMTNSPIDYLYSYNISSEVKNKVMQKLGVSESNISSKTCTFFPSNSLSIINVCNLLQKIQCKKIGILYPAYFSISACLNTYGLKTIPFYITRKQQKYFIPIEDILRKKPDALWITSPIYSTGVSYDHNNIDIIEKILQLGIQVILDESFCIKGQELIRKFSKYKNFISIYSPHKAISFNSYKFSSIICEDCYEDLLDQWLDVFCGNLPQTSIAAINHYLSDNYDICYQGFQNFIKHAYDRVISVLHRFSNIDFDYITYGNLMTIYIKNLDYTKSQSMDFLLDVLNNTYALYYPGYLNGFAKSMGFCFRINLALYNSEFIASFERLLAYLCQNL